MGFKCIGLGRLFFSVLYFEHRTHKLGLKQTVGLAGHSGKSRLEAPERFMALQWKHLKEVVYPDTGLWITTSTQVVWASFVVHG